MAWQEQLLEIQPYLFEVPKTAVPGMRVPAQVYATKALLDEVGADRSLSQLVNMAMLPGVVEPVIAMPDIHEGYGFPIGGVAATALPDGVISPGAIGYDVNCGVRLLVSDLREAAARPKLGELASQMMAAVPSGTGRGGTIRLSNSEIDDVLKEGAAWCVRRGLGKPADVEHTEESGRMRDAQPKYVSQRAKQRGRDQLGTLGSGNHFLEVQVVEKLFDEGAAQVFGLKPGQVAIAIHCGSRGVGHQVCTEYVRLMLHKQPQYSFRLPDPELACAPADSPEGQEYLAAMAAAANFAWANRQTITHHVRERWNSIFGDRHPLRVLYDVSHNMAKRERHVVGGRERELLVHRKGATRAFGPGRVEVPAAYRAVGQPVLIPGTMGTASYVLSGTEQAMVPTFGTVCHGAGRRMSRHAARRTVRGEELRQRLEAQGIVIRCHSLAGLVEEAPEAYKDVEAVVDVVERAGLAKRVARLKPLAVIKGE